MITQTDKTLSLPSVADAFGIARDVYQENVDARYRMAKQDRFTRKLEGFPDGASSDHHFESESDYFYMVERARELDRDDIIAGAVINRLVGNILQNGFAPTPTTGSEQADSYLAMRWKDWAESPTECDHQHENTLHQLARFCLRDVFVAGDIAALKLGTGRVQLIENHRIKTPTDAPKGDNVNTIFGVELDGSRRRRAYWVTRDDIALHEFVKASDSRRIKTFDDQGRRQVIHLYHPKRITQTRGLTALAPVSNSCAMHDDVQFAKLIHQQAVSIFTTVRTRPLGFELPDDAMENYRYEMDPGQEGQFRAIKNIAPGMMYTTYPGETLEGFSANVPNPTFFDHAKSIQQLVAMNLDVPLVMLLYDGSETNFSGWRGALEQAKIAYRALQTWFASEFHQVLYEWKLRQWTTPGSPQSDPYLVSVANQIDLFSHQWVTPRWASIEPLKDSMDRISRVANNQVSHRRAMAEEGIDFANEIVDIVEDRGRIIELAILKAKELNDKYPDNPHPVSWLQCAATPLPEGFTMSLSATVDPQQEPAPNVAPPSTK